MIDLRTVATVLLMATAASCAVETMERFQPKLQIGKELSVDRMRAQNLNIVQKAVEGIREHLPQKVDSYTTLVDVEGEGTTLIYVFRVANGAKSDATLKEEGVRMASRIEQGICLSSKRFLQADIALRYRYLSSATGEEILRVDTNRSRCEKIEGNL